jgi:putative transposase
VTQRGNGRQQVFFGDDDYAAYRDLLAQRAERAGAQVWSCCRMPDHVPVMVVTADPDGVRRTCADTHRRYAGFINARNRRTGPLWQGRHGAAVMGGGPRVPGTRRAG